MTLIMPTIEDAYGVMETLKARQGYVKPDRTGPRIVRIKDRMTNVDGKPVDVIAHYRDFLQNIKLSNDAIVELQVTFDQMYTAKEKMGGHLLYEIDDQINEALKENKIEREEAKEILRLCRTASRELYDAAFEAALDGAIFSASSLDMSSQFVAISDHFQESGANSKLLSEKTLNKLMGTSGYASGLSSQEMNSSSGSSKSGTGEEAGGTKAGDSLNKVVSDTELPSTESIAQNEKKVNPYDEVINENDVDTSGLAETEKKFIESPGYRGRDDLINLGGREIKGHWELREADAATASHNPLDHFRPNKYYPKHISDGRSTNTRDYPSSVHEQDGVRAMGADYDKRGAEITVYKGAVVDGNGRKQARELAALNGTDGKFLDYLKNYGTGKYGYTTEMVDALKHPTNYFVIDEVIDFTPEFLAEFNQDNSKGEEVTQTAVNISRILTEKNREDLARIAGKYDDIESLEKNSKGLAEIFEYLKKNRFIGPLEIANYWSPQTGLSGNGEDLIESFFLGAVLNEANVKALNEHKDIRRKILKASTILAENKAMGDFSYNGGLNLAVNYVIESRSKTQDGKPVFATFDDYAGQKSLFDEAKDAGALGLARILAEGGPNDFADTVATLNGLMFLASKGQLDLIGGRSRDEMLADWFLLKSRERQAARVIADPEASVTQKEAAALDSAAAARSEETLYQVIGEKGAEALDRARESTFLLDNKRIAAEMEAGEVINKAEWATLTDQEKAQRIRLATGWERGADGLWRYEVADIEVVFGGNESFFEQNIIGEGEAKTLKEIVKGEGADQLFAAYPQFRDMKVWKNGNRNFYNGNIVIAVQTSNDEIRSVLVHEIEHAIQQVEGFARGGDWEMFDFKIDDKKLKAAWEKLESILDDNGQSKLASIYDINQLLRNKEEHRSRISREQNEFLEVIGERDWTEQENTEYEKLTTREAEARADYERLVDQLQSLTNELIREVGEDAFDEVRRAYDNIRYPAKISPYTQYRSLAGEVEARNVQRRLAMSPRERRARLLAETEDVARDEQIFIREGLGTAMALAEALPGAEELAEAQRQYDEVVSRYHDAQGNALPGWLAMPEGTSLSERQWVQVHTENFKKTGYFGDWEAVIIKDQIDQRSRIEVKSPDAETQEILAAYNEGKEGWRQTLIQWATKLVPAELKDPDGKKVLFNNTSVRNIISHGKGPLKILTMADLPAMLENGVLYHTDANTDKQGRTERFFNYAYPITFEGKPWLVSLVVKEDYNGNRFYDDEFVQEIKTGELPTGQDPSTRGSLTHPSAIKILQDILSVNPDSVSKVVDKNGWPLPVWHSGDFGTGDNFTPNGPMHFGTRAAAEQRAAAKQTDDLLKSIEILEDEENGGYYWTAGDIEAEEGKSWSTETKARDNAISTILEMAEYSEGEEDQTTYTQAFLNIKNPAYTEDAGNEAGWNTEIEKAKEKGHDGIFYYNKIEDRMSLSYLTFSPSQAKSATDNAGTFNTDYDTTLFQTRGELLEEAQGYDTWEAFRDDYLKRAGEEDRYTVVGADDGWFKRFWEEAQRARETAEVKADAGEAADEAWLREMKRETVEGELLPALYDALVRNRAEPVEERDEAGQETEEYRNALDEYRRQVAVRERVDRELPNAGLWKRAATPTPSPASLAASPVPSTGTSNRTSSPLRCLVPRGALSVDKHRRRNRVSWWEEEYWSTKEKQDLVSLLQHENNFDYVFSFIVTQTPLLSTRDT